MCFSIEASFGASAILSVIGIASIKKVKQRSQLAFASIPLIFGMQQFMEGLVWEGLSMSSIATWLSIPIRGYLIFAHIVWPIWIPFSLILIEKEIKRNKVILIFLAIGISLSIYLAYCMITYNVNAVIRNHHIHYILDYPNWLLPVGGISYFIPTVISLITSSIKGMRLLGTSILIAYIFSKLFFGDNVISIWCFFAAILSVIVYSIVKKLPASALPD